MHHFGGECWFGEAVPWGCDESKWELTVLSAQFWHELKILPNISLLKSD